MDAVLGRFLASVRPRSRPVHLSTYEELAWQLDAFLRRRSSRAGLRAATLRGFLGAWFVAERDAAGPGARRFCAALRVLAAWLVQDVDPLRARRLRRSVASATREAVRAARVGELLAAEAPRRGAGLDVAGRAGYWEVVLRGESHAVVRALGESRLVGPVLLPAPVVRHLRPGTVLVLRLVAEREHWRVADHGPCYPSVTWLAAHPAAAPARA